MRVYVTRLRIVDILLTDRYNEAKENGNMQKQELIRIIMDHLEPFIGGKLTKKWTKETNEYSLMLNSNTEIFKTTKVASFIDALMGIYNWEMFKRNNPEQ